MDGLLPLYMREANRLERSVGFGLVLSGAVNLSERASLVIFEVLRLRLDAVTLFRGSCFRLRGIQPYGLPALPVLLAKELIDLVETGHDLLGQGISLVRDCLTACSILIRLLTGLIGHF